jgi:hypothetical protein
MPFKMERIQPIPLGQPGVIKPMGLLLSPHGSKLCVVDTATSKPTGSFEVGQRPWGMAFSQDAKTLFTANGPSNDISVVDLAMQKVTKEDEMHRQPLGHRCRSALIMSVCDRPHGRFEWAFGPRNPMKNWHHEEGGSGEVVTTVENSRSLACLTRGMRALRK